MLAFFFFFRYNPEIFFNPNPKMSQTDRQQYQEKFSYKEKAKSKIKYQSNRETSSFASKAEQQFLMTQVESKESIQHARQVIKAWNKEYDALVETSEARAKQLAGYKLGLNEFVWNIDTTATSVDQSPIMKVRDGLVFFRNGNWEGRSVFTMEEFESILDTQLRCKKSCTKTRHKVPACVPMPHKCKEIQNITNVYPTMIVVVPGQGTQQCSMHNCTKPNCNTVTYRPETQCYDVSMTCAGNHIEGSFTDPDFCGFLSECNGRFDIDRFAKMKQCTVRPIAAPVQKLCNKFPKYVTNKPDCGFPLQPNQMVLCNSYEFCDPDPTFSTQHGCQYGEVFPVCEHKCTKGKDEYQVVISGNKCTFNEAQFCDFIKQYYRDHCTEVCHEPVKEKPKFKPCCVDRPERYTQKYMQKRYMDRVNRLDSRFNKKLNRNDIRLKAQTDRLNLKAQKHLDAYYNALEACQDPQDKKLQRKLDRAKKYQEKICKKYEKYADRKQKLVDKFPPKIQDVKTKGKDNLVERRGKNQEKFDKKRERKLKRAKRKFDRTSR